MNKQLDSYIKNFIKKYNDKTIKSKNRAAEVRAVLADSRACAGFRFSIKELLYPIVGKGGNRAHFYDIDDNKYLDMAMGFGCLLFGHYPDFLVGALENHLGNAIQLGPQAEETHQVATLLHELTGVERFAFCNSGTEAIMMACRLARLKTEKTKIVIFSNSYHGNYDGTLGLKQAGSEQPLPLCAGLTDSLVNSTLMLNYNNMDDLNKLYLHRNEIAGILVEPVQSRSPENHSVLFLKRLREICDDINAVLIFDEIITGFRCHVGGAKALFNVTADMHIYGKVIGGGLPAGVIGGSYSIMSGIDGGHWNYGDKSYPRESTTFFAGTFNKNPLTLCAMHAVLKKLKHEGHDIIQTLDRYAEHASTILNAFFVKQNIPISTSYFSSLLKFNTKRNLDLFFYHLIYHGVYVWEGRTFFMSHAHTPDDIAFFIETVKKVSLELQQIGFFDHDSRTAPRANALE